MFCPKCGNQITDDSKFCASCGTPVSAPAHTVEAPAPAPTVEAPAPTPVVEAPAPTPVVEAPAKKVKFTLPDVMGWISLGILTLVFILSFVPWTHVDYHGYGYVLYGIIPSNLMYMTSQLFSTLGTILKVFSILVMPVAAATHFFNFDGLIKFFMPIKKFANLVYFALIVLWICCMVVVTVLNTYLDMGFFGYFEFLLVAGGIVLTLIPGKVKNTVDKVVK